MRAALALLAVLIAVPLSGCIGGPGVAVVTLFSDWEMPAGSPAPVPVGDCQELDGILRERAFDESATFLDQSVKGIHGGGWWGGPVMRGLAFDAETTASDSAGAPSSAAAPSARDAEVTGTNNQEEGVDEADLLKTDGEWTYVLQDGILYILHSTTVGNISEYARVEVGQIYMGGQLLLERRDAADQDDDRLVVITQTFRTENIGIREGEPGSDHSQQRDYTQIRVYDLADRRDPTVLKETFIEGHSVGARLVDGHAYVVVHSSRNDLPLRIQAPPNQEDLDARGLTWRTYSESSETEQEALRRDIAEVARQKNLEVLANTTLEDHLPRVLEGDGDGLVHPRPIDDDACKRFLVTENATGRSISTILSLAVAEDEVQHATVQALGSQPIVYGALDALVLAAPSRDAWWFWSHRDVDEATDLQWYDLDGLDVVPRASGRVPGIVQDSFGIDVHNGTLRIATTTGQWGRWWIDQEEREPMMNHLVILESSAGELLPTGMVGGIAPGERIWSARFTDTRAYIVTFEQIDPLWIIDLTDKTEPRILGELEIPGVSTYIHPLSDELLLTIGIGPREDGTGLDWSRIQVSLFDISDETKPTRAAVMDVSPPGGWSWSGATREHKAFTYWDRLGLLAIPMSTHHYDQFTYDHHVALRLITVDTENKELRLYGEVDQDALVPTEGRWYGSTEIQRSYFLGLPDEGTVSVYAMSRLGVTAHDLETLHEQDRVRFAMTDGPHYRID